MIIYKDILTGDEIISDAYPLKDSPNYPGCWEVDLKMVTVGGEDFALEGANASAEGEDAGEGLDDSKEQKLEIVHSFQLATVAKPEKKGAMAEYKKYMKAVVAKMKENGKSEGEVKAFQKNAVTSVSAIATKWNDWDLYAGESFDPSEPSMWVLVDYRDDGVTPYAVIWKDAVTEYKV